MLDGMIDDGIAIIPTVRYESFCLKIFYKLQSLLTVSLCTCCNKSSEGHTMRIHGQMYLGVEPPFVRPIAWLPPTAPEASAWTLQCVASIISHSRAGSLMITPSSLTQIPLSLHLEKRLWVFFQSP